jgi:hypothetical protein
MKGRWISWAFIVNWKWMKKRRQMELVKERIFWRLVGERWKKVMDEMARLRSLGS